ncbi:MAG: tetratricopeptide repeat protein [Alphaproteobacteria bacterium]|nr:tetratricopeptide repeat protein [Alphaproteobacteria bacterium]
MSARTAALLVVVLTGCAGARATGMKLRPEVEPTPAWQTEDGRKQTWRDMARWYMDNLMPVEALEMVQRLREDGVDTAELRAIQGRALSMQGAHTEAKVVLEEVVRKWPREAEAWEALGVVRTDLGEIEPALDAFERSVKLDPERASARNNLAYLLINQSRCTEAIEHLEDVVAKDSTVARYRNNLALALVCAGDAPRALQLFRTTGTEADARYNLGAALEREGMTLGAILQYQQALEIAPNHGPATEALARLGPEASPPEGAEP